METRPARQPVLHLLVFVGVVVVDNEVDVQILGRFPVNLLEETQPLDMGVTRFGAADELAIQIVGRREERYRAVADVVVGSLDKILSRVARGTSVHS